MFLEKSILQAQIHDIDLENSFHGGKAFIIILWERLPTGLGNYVVRPLARQQLLWQIQRHEEETTRFGSVMRIYNPLLQQEEDEIDRRFVVAVDTLEIVQADSHTIERIIFGVDSRYSSETVLFRTTNL